MLEQVSDPSVFDILFDECQTEFEVHRHRHVHADSNVLWFKRMMSSHAFNTPVSWTFRLFVTSVM